MSALVRMEPGYVVAGEFRVIRPLAEGGMGAVYVVEQLSTGKQRALKVMHPQFVLDARARERFAQEARVGANIASEHVVEVVAAGVDPGTGTPWLAMELLNGEDLATVLQQRGCLQPSEVLEVFTQLCHALQAAHAVGLVHRDLKPENVFLSTSRRVGSPFMVKVLDFGIAKLVQETKTANTQAMGSPLWMAPEQTESSGRIRPATDVWALALVAFRMLTGRFYWRGANDENGSVMGLLREVVMDPIVSATQRASEFGVHHLLPPGFDAWFARCLQRNADQRFANAGDALHALAPVLQGVAATGYPATVMQPAAVAPTAAFQPGQAFGQMSGHGANAGFAGGPSNPANAAYGAAQSNPGQQVYGAAQSNPGQPVYGAAQSNPGQAAYAGAQPGNAFAPPSGQRAAYGAMSPPHGSPNAMAPTHVPMPRGGTDVGAGPGGGVPHVASTVAWSPGDGTAGPAGGPTPWQPSVTGPAVDPRLANTGGAKKPTHPAVWIGGGVLFGVLLLVVGFAIAGNGRRGRRTLGSNTNTVALNTNAGVSGTATNATNATNAANAANTANAANAANTANAANAATANNAATATAPHTTALNGSIGGPSANAGAGTTQAGAMPAGTTQAGTTGSIGGVPTPNPGTTTATQPDAGAAGTVATAPASDAGAVGAPPHGRPIMSASQRVALARLLRSRSRTSAFGSQYGTPQYGTQYGNQYGTPQYGNQYGANSGSSFVRTRRSDLDGNCRALGAPGFGYMVTGATNHAMARASGCRPGLNMFGSPDPDIFCCRY